MKAQVAIVGAGPGGTTAALYLLREGIKPIIIEKDPFPRYHVGESMTGECGAIVRDLGLEDKMLEHGYPIKHGVKVYGNNPWWVPVMSRDAENNLQDAVTWQVRRSSFDRMLLDEAVARGATLVRGKASNPIVDEDGTVRGVEVRLEEGGTVNIETEVLIDSSGSSTFLAHAGVTGPKFLGHYDKQIAIYSQIKGGIRDEGEARDMDPGNTLIFYASKFHWSWWIPIDDEVTSVGIVVPASNFIEKNETKREFLLRELQEIHPELTRRVGDVELVEDVRSVKNYSYQIQGFSGKGFVCVGDAHRFLDPIFSFGLYVAMKEGQLVAPVIKEILDGKRNDLDNPFEDYQRYVEEGIDVLEDALDGFWEHPFAFAMLVHHRHVEDMVDIFAGRIYENQPSDATVSFRKLMDRKRGGEIGDEYSIPIGSRYHADRAPIWEDRPVDLETLGELLEN